MWRKCQQLKSRFFQIVALPIDKSEGVVKDSGFLCGALSTAASPEG